MKITVDAINIPNNPKVKRFWNQKSTLNILNDIKRIKVCPVFISNK